MMNTGALGELICKINLCHARFFIPSIIGTEKNFQNFPVRRQLMGYVGISEFLVSLTGESELVSKYLESNKKLKNALVSFSYFHKWQDNIRDLDALLGECIIRGCALQLNSNYDGIDLLIPIVLTDGRLSFIAVQVKMWKSGLKDTNEARIELLHDRMSFDNIFCKVPLPAARPYGCILQNIHSDLNVLDCTMRDGLEEDVEKLPSCILIFGSYSASMNNTYRVMLSDGCRDRISIPEVLTGLKLEDFERKEQILRTYYGPELLQEIQDKITRTTTRRSVQKSEK